jgi:hypothetical protein
LREDQGKECYQKIKTQVEQMPKVTFYVIDSCRRHLVDGLAGLPNVRFMSGRNIFEFFEDLDSRQ